MRGDFSLRKAWDETHPELDGLGSAPLPARGIGRMLDALDRHTVSVSLIAFLFGITGPIAVLVAVATGAGLSEPEISSWIFAGYGIGGAMSIIFAIRYRQPLLFHFSIPGTVLAGPALQRLSLEEVVGAYLVTGLIVTVLGISGWARRFMSLIPMPIVMGMVAGVFLPFGLGILTAFENAPWVTVAATGMYLVLAMNGHMSRTVPPVLGALAVGSIAIFAGTGTEVTFDFRSVLAEPVFLRPRFSLQSIMELVIPLTVTIVAVNNAQGLAILDKAGHRPRTSAITTISGLGSIVLGAMGSVPACLPGVMMAIIAAGRHAERHYLAAVVTGILFVLFGVFAPLTVALATVLPASFVALLGGLALITVLRSTFVSAFNGSFSLGVLVAFMVTISGVTILGIGAGFWGLVFGVAVSWMLERDDFRRFDRGAEA